MRLASIETTTHCDPNFLAACLISSGFSTADVFIATLSAPTRSKRRTSSIVCTPPPTVIGINQSSANSPTSSKSGCLPSLVAVISRNINSSTSRILYTLTACMALPTRRQLSKRIPFTKPTSLCNSVGMIRVLSVISIHLGQVTVLIFYQVPPGIANEQLFVGKAITNLDKLIYRHIDLLQDALKWHLQVFPWKLAVVHCD